MTRPTIYSPDTDYDDLLRAQEREEARTKAHHRCDLPLNVACFVAPLIVSPLMGRLWVLGLLPLLCIPGGLVVALIPGPAKVRYAAACAFLGDWPECFSVVAAS